MDKRISNGTFIFNFIWDCDYDLYRKTGTAVKVSVYIPNRGAFWVLMDNCGKLQRGRRYIYMNNKNLTMHDKLFVGSGKTASVFIDENFFPHFDGLADWQKNCIYPCIRNLRRAFLLYTSGDVSTPNHTALSAEERQAILEAIKEVEDKFNSMPIASMPNAVNPVAEAEEDGTASVEDTTADEGETPFARVENVASLGEEVLSAIQNGIVSSNGSVDGMVIRHGDTEYKFKQEGNELVLYSREVKGKAVETAPAEENTPVPCETKRKTVSVVLVTDDEGLTEFVKGEFYPVMDGTETFNGTMYYPVRNANGEKRYLSVHRAKVVEIFAEPPKEEDKEVAMA